jgi:hypothetical protein
MRESNRSAQVVTGLDLGNSTNCSAAKGAAVSDCTTPYCAEDEHDLQRVIEAWPNLPEDVQAAILDLVDSALLSGQGLQ